MLIAWGGATGWARGSVARGSSSTAAHAQQRGDRAGGSYQPLSVLPPGSVPYRERVLRREADEEANGAEGMAGGHGVVERRFDGEQCSGQCR